MSEELRGIRAGDTVVLHYRITCDAQTILDTHAGAPSTLRIGQGDIDPRMESHLLGLHIGRHATFDLQAEDAFGPYDVALRQTFRRTEFPQPNELEIGHEVEFPMPNGQVILGYIRSMDAESVLVDFNHPLAGRAIHWTVEILDVKEARE